MYLGLFVSESHASMIVKVLEGCYGRGFPAGLGLVRKASRVGERSHGDRRR
jgi:hypothetical protein